MKRSTHALFLTGVIILLNATLVGPAFSQSTGFVYQGQLNENGSPANGTNYALTFTLYDAPTNGTQQGSVALTGQSISNGIFAATLDFGGAVFSGADLWLEIVVQKNGGTPTTLLPRQKILPVPKAITALNLAGVLKYNTLGTNGDVVGGGYANTANGGWSVVSGGVENTASSGSSTIAGGYNNTVAGDYATVGGGFRNDSTGLSATIAGGNHNYATAMYATVGGGYNNYSGGWYSTVPGGYYNSASGVGAFAAGIWANAQHNGAFVWADSQNTPGGPSYSSDRADQFKIRAGGGIIMDVAGSHGLNPAAVVINDTSGNGVGLWIAENSTDGALVVGNAGSGSLIRGFDSDFGGNPVFEVRNDGSVYSRAVLLTSDRNAKENFKGVDSAEILDKVSGLPVTEWNYKNEKPGTKHLGPTAQDFQKAFHLSSDDTHISVIDEGGVALAAIQGLNQKLMQEISRRDRENAELRQRLEKLELLLHEGNANLR